MSHPISNCQARWWQFVHKLNSGQAFYAMPIVDALSQVQHRGDKGPRKSVALHGAT